MNNNRPLDYYKLINEQLMGFHKQLMGFHKDVKANYKDLKVLSPTDYSFYINMIMEVTLCSYCSHCLHPSRGSTKTWLCHALVIQCPAHNEYHLSSQLRCPIASNSAIALRPMKYGHAWMDDISRSYSERHQTCLPGSAMWHVLLFSLFTNWTQEGKAFDMHVH